MSSSDPSKKLYRRSFVLGLSALVAGCGFKPMLQENGRASVWIGSISIQEAYDPETQAFRERARRRLGNAGSAALYHLTYRLAMTSSNVAITSNADNTRKLVEARATWQLIHRDSGDEVLSGKVLSNGAFDATAGPYATLSAERAEKADLARELAERVTARILSSPSPEGS